MWFARNILLVMDLKMESNAFRIPLLISLFVSSKASGYLIPY